MKKVSAIVIGLIAGVLGVIVMGGETKPQAVSVSNSSTLVVPATRPLFYSDNSTAADWKAAAYDRGDYIRIVASNKNKYYWCITAGTTATNFPTWSTTADITSGTAVFRYIPPRSRVVVVNPTSNALSFGFGEAAVAGSGITVGQYGNIDEKWQGEIYAIFASTTNDVGVQYFRK